MTRSALEIRNPRPLRALLMASSALVATVAVPSAVHAQDAPQTTSATEEAAPDIVVTARMKNETLQEVPVTVAVVDGKTLNEFHATKPEDLTTRVPALNIQVGGSGSGGSIALRGVGSSAISSSFDSAIAFDFDGVQVSTMRLVQAGFFDVGQVELLKGPQSLYFGKSASAGVFSLKSANPTKTWQIGATGSYEFEERDKVINGYISGPISDTLGVRLAAQYNQISRFEQLQPGTPAVNKQRGLKDFVGRATLAWNPVSNFSANFKFQYTRNETDGAISNSEVFCGANGRADEIYLLSGTVAIPAGYNCNINDQKYFLPDVNPALAKSPPLPQRAKVANFNGVPFGETDLYFSRLRMDWDVTDKLRLSSTTGYVNLNAIDIDSYSYGGVGPIFSPVANALGLPIGPFLQGAFKLANPPAFLANNTSTTPSGVGSSDPNNKLEQFSQELRLASNFDGPINFMIGGFYEHRKFTFDTSEQAVNISLLFPDPSTGYTFDYRRIHVTKTNAYSGFGSLTFKPTDQLEISGGVRYTKEDKTNTINIPYVHAFLQAIGFVKNGFASGPIKFDDDNVSPEATIKYKVTPNFNVFASYKTGFKSGGIDNSALPSNSLLGFASADPAVRAATAAGLIYKSEKAKGGEIGFKSELAGRTLTLNGTLFYYEFKNLQTQIFNATAVQFITLNAGKAVTKGGELEMRWQTPVQGLTLSGAVSFLNSKYKSFVLPGADLKLGTADDVSLSGRKLARAPDVSGNFAFDYRTPLGQSLILGLSGNMTYNSSYITNSSSFADYVQGSFATFDGRVSLGTEDGKYQLALVGKNIGNRVYTNTSGDRPFLAPAGALVPKGDDIILNQNRGRQVFIEASVKF